MYQPFIKIFIRMCGASALATCLAIFLTSCTYTATGTLNFSDTNPRFLEDAGEMSSLTLAIDFTAFHLYPEAQITGAGVIDCKY